MERHILTSLLWAKKFMKAGITTTSIMEKNLSSVSIDSLAQEQDHVLLERSALEDMNLLTIIKLTMNAQFKFKLKELLIQLI